MRPGRLLLLLAALPLPSWALSANMQAVLSNMGGMVWQYAYILAAAFAMLLTPTLCRKAVERIQSNREAAVEEANQSRVDDFYGAQLSQQESDPEPAHHGWSDSRGATLTDTVIASDWHSFLYADAPTPQEFHAMVRSDELMAGALEDLRTDILASFDGEMMGDVAGPGDPEFDSAFKERLDLRFSFLGDLDSASEADPADDPEFQPGRRTDTSDWIL